MAKRVSWTREQLLIALRLYMRSPFGRLHARNPEIVDLALKIGRTPSAVAMKACNFASLDPAFRASQRKGLSGASDADRAIWNEFLADPEKIAAEAEEYCARIRPQIPDTDDAAIQIPAGETDVLRLIRARRVQSFFRAAVLTSYEERCAITGLGKLCTGGCAGGSCSEHGDQIHPNSGKVHRERRFCAGSRRFPAFTALTRDTSPPMASTVA
jgi:hypothetical protein